MDNSGVLSIGKMSDGEYVDFTSDSYIPQKTKPGIPYDPIYSPQKAAGLLMKVARKSKGAVRHSKGTKAGAAKTGPSKK